MATINAKEKSKEESGKKFAKQIRNNGWVPGVIYGEKQDPLAISFDPVDFVKQIHRSEFKQNQIFEVKIDESKTERVITKEIKVNPINNQFIHVDFLRVNDKNSIEINVPINVEGISAGQKVGGVLVKPKSSVKVKCLPTDIPKYLTVDVTPLKIGENIRTENLNVEKSQQITSNPKDILVKVESTKISKLASSAEDAGDGTASAGAAEGADAPAE
ncbi:MAG: 50S ribosomal protein L25 [Candidatus Marinamargulisbacteria bacterium]